MPYVYAVLNGAVCIENPIWVYRMTESAKFA